MKRQTLRAGDSECSMDKTCSSRKRRGGGGSGQTKTCSSQKQRERIKIMANRKRRENKKKKASKPITKRPKPTSSHNSTPSNLSVTERRWAQVLIQKRCEPIRSSLAETHTKHQPRGVGTKPWETSPSSPALTEHPGHRDCRACLPLLPTSQGRFAPSKQTTCTDREIHYREGRKQQSPVFREAGVIHFLSSRHIMCTWWHTPLPFTN